jgi:hypothetical protein
LSPTNTTENHASTDQRNTELNISHSDAQRKQNPERKSERESTIAMHWMREKQDAMKNNKKEEERKFSEGHGFSFKGQRESSVMGNI